VLEAARMREEKGFHQPAALSAATRGVSILLRRFLAHVHEKWKTIQPARAAIIRILAVAPRQHRRKFGHGAALRRVNGGKFVIINFQLSYFRGGKELVMKLCRIFAVSLTTLALAGCYGARLPDPKLSARDAEFLALAPQAQVSAEFDRYLVDYKTNEPVGTIVVDSRAHHLFYVMPGGKAVRYGVATGQDAMGWTGRAYVGAMQEWPRWIPPKDMLERWPHLQPTADAGGLPGGPDNPLGSRALYLYQDGKDTLYRIHGTNEPEKIGQGVSSGCIRMRDIDAIDLYGRVKVGTKVVVI
jgi:lipoprotein-anchoring transpeptidase ErfK/SrfK